MEEAMEKMEREVRNDRENGMSLEDIAVKYNLSLLHAMCIVGEFPITEESLSKKIYIGLRCLHQQGMTESEIALRTGTPMKMVDLSLKESRSISGEEEYAARTDITADEVKELKRQLFEIKANEVVKELKRKLDELKGVEEAKPIPLFVLEARLIRHNEGRYFQEENSVGIFSTREKAVDFIKENPDYLDDEEQFYSIYGGILDVGGPDGIVEGSMRYYDQKGETIPSPALYNMFNSAFVKAQKKSDESLVEVEKKPVIYGTPEFFAVLETYKSHSDHDRLTQIAIKILQVPIDDVNDLPEMKELMENYGEKWRDVINKKLEELWEIWNIIDME